MTVSITEEVKPTGKLITIALLVTKEMKPIPENVEVLSDWGFTSVREKESGNYTDGNHMMVRAERGAYVGWLGHLDGFWISKGAPQFEQFETVHISDEFLGEKDA